MDPPITTLCFPEDLEKKPSASLQMSDDEILRELCMSNGLAFERLSVEGPLIESLETFFSGFPRLIPINVYFPNLSQLCIVGQYVSQIENISSLIKLEELWIAECKLKTTTGIKTLQGLRKLYLQDNQIEGIQQLENLTALQVLWLSGNELTDLAGIEGLKELRELNVADNKISLIGNCLSNCKKLEILEMSGNKISSFRELSSLLKLPWLTQVGFGDAKYSSNPICDLCNYTTQVLYHLPNIRRLDGHDLTSKQYSDLAQSTVMKKMMFYNMKLKTICCQAQTFLSKLTEYRDQVVLKDILDHITHLCLQLKNVEVLLRRETPRLYETSTPEQIKRLEEKMSLIRERIREWELKCGSIEAYYNHYRTSAFKSLNKLTSRLCLELESGGNIRFEIGQQSDPWFTSCYDMMLSRFCAADYRELGIQGVKIHRITRVYHRILRFKFEEKLSKIYPEHTGVEESSYRTQQLHKQMEYLYYIWPADGPDPLRCVEVGFPETCGEIQAVPLTNALSMSDANRVASEIKKSKPSERVDSCPYRYGTAILSKVFLGSNEPTLDSSNVNKKSHPACESVYKPRKSRPFLGLGSQSTTILAAESTNNTSGGSHPSKCDCAQKQQTWFVFDNELVLPEYIIEFEYVTKEGEVDNAVSKPLPLRNAFKQFDFMVLEPPAAFTSASFVSNILPADEDILELSPQLPDQPESMIGDLTQPTLLSFLYVDSLDHVTTLNLHNQGLTHLAGIQALSSLKNLVISFNDINSLELLTDMPLEVIDASFNKIHSLDGMRNMYSLRKLDISWNSMRYMRDEFAILRKHAPQLQELDCLHNLWLKPDEFRLRVISRIKTLQELNGVPISESEATAALRMATGSRIMPLHVMSHGRTDFVKPRSLSLRNSAQILHDTSRMIPDRSVSPNDMSWTTSITSLCLDSQHICKLSSLEKLANLRWASFNNNHIHKIEGLDACPKLEELSLDNNCIYKLEGIHRLTHLKVLSLSDNYIVHLDPSQLDRLHHLHHLALDRNKLTSLSGVQRCKSLVELYVNHNRIHNSRDAFYLKLCTHLLILDLSENPVTRVDQYRVFMIYHISSLKAFDGSPVEQVEVSQAREILGGRLTVDFIAERVGHSNFHDIKEIDLPSLSLRSIDLGTAEQFTMLRSVNLEHNNLTSFGGLVQLPNLRVLCLNHNKIECITSSANNPLSNSSSEYDSQRTAPILESLEVLHLAYNQIKDISNLQISRLSGLKALFLQGNELQTISGLEGLHDLRELVLDKNKIKCLTEHSLANQWNLQELHLEENRLRELSHLGNLDNLQRLYLGMNRVQDLSELEKLSPLTQLVDLSLVSCPVSRRLVHRPLLVYRIPSLAVIDGIPVSEEESLKAQLYYMQQEQQAQQNGEVLPGITQQNPGVLIKSAAVPVKVTNMSLGAFGERTPWSGTLQFDPGLLSQPEPRENTSLQGRKQVAGSNRGATGNPQSFNIQSTYANQANHANKNLYGDLTNPFNNRPRK